MTNEGDNINTVTLEMKGVILLRADSVLQYLCVLSLSQIAIENFISL